MFYIEKSLVEIKIPCHSKTLPLDILQLTRCASPLLPFVDGKSGGEHFEERVVQND